MVLCQSNHWLAQNHLKTRKKVHLQLEWNCVKSPKKLRKQMMLTSCQRGAEWAGSAFFKQRKYILSYTAFRSNCHSWCGLCKLFFLFFLACNKEASRVNWGKKERNLSKRSLMIAYHSIPCMMAILTTYHIYLPSL